ncbi:MAG: branched-chain amino acid transporter permease [Chthonomonadaceae bacterium]|nr:branched-chain amino acid transporter permease [Chthonomonadaceae bacterium]
MAQLLVSGLATGAVYALIALGYSLVYRSTRTINFAQGDLLMVAGYLGYWAHGKLGLSLIPGYVVAVVGVMALIAAIEVVGFKPMYSHRSGPILVIVSSIGLVLVLQTTMQLLWGPQALSVPAAVSGTALSGAVVITKQQVLVIATAAVLIVLLELLLRTRFGTGMRAAAENRDIASLLGVDGQRMATVAYALGGGLAAVGGILITPTTLLTPTGGATIGLLGLVGAIVGGLGNLRGGVVGGLAIGVIASFASYIVGGAYSEVVVFGVLVVFLVAKPAGLLGEEGMVSRV